MWLSSQETGAVRTSIAVLVVLSTAVVVLSLGVGAVAADGSIDTIEITNKTDADDDGNLSNFDVRVEADTRVSEYGYGNTHGEPRVVVTAENQSRFLYVDRQSDWAHTAQFDGPKIANESGSVTVTVELYDYDPQNSNDRRAMKTKTVDYEPATKDFTDRELARIGIESLYPSYNEYTNRWFNADYWESSAWENVERAAKAANPVPTSKRGAAIELITRTTGVGGPATTTWTAVQTGVWSGIGYIEGKMSSLLTLTNGYGEGTYYQFRLDLKELRQNTKKIRNAETEAQLRENISTREELLRDLYKTENRYRLSIESLAESNDGWSGVVEASEWDYNLFKSEFDEFEKHLIADYYWTQMYLNQGANEYANLTDAVGNPPTLSPDPQITSVSIPETTKAGESVNISVQVTNGGVDAPFQSIAISFPDADNAQSMSIANTDFPNQGYASVFAPGEQVGASYGQANVTLAYPLAEVGGGWEQGERKSLTVEATPQTSGEFTVYVKSVAQDGGWAAVPAIGSGSSTDQQSESVKTHTITVKENNIAPSATFEHTYDTPTTRDRVRFDASGSTDPDGTIATYAWDFDGDGTVDQTTDQPVVRHKYQQSGKYTATLNVTDDDGSHDTTTVPLTVEPAEPPYYSVEVSGTENGTDSVTDYEVVSGRTLNVVVDLKNKDDFSGRQNVSVVLQTGTDGEVIGQTQKTVFLDAGESITRVLSVPTDGFNPDYASLTKTTVSIENPGSVRTIQGNVLPNTSLVAVSVNETNQPVEPGEPVTVTTTASNNGYVATTQTVSLTIDGLGTDSTSVNLDAGESTQVSLSVPTNENDRGSYDGSVASDDYSVTVPVDVFETTGADVSPVDLEGSGTTADPYVVTNVSELQAMEDDLSAHYVLGNDIEASETASWNGGAGFDPIGNSFGTDGGPFSGTFDGDGHTIRGLTVDRPDEKYVGLIGYQQAGESTVKNVVLRNVSITGDESVGGLIGYSNGAVRKSSTSGTVRGTSDVGGLVGFLGYDGSIQQSSASGSVSGIEGQYGASGDIGGLVGEIGATSDTTGGVEMVYATATVTGSYDVGGLVGINSGSIRRSFATGRVSGTGRVGGLVGDTATAERWPAPSTTASYWGTGATGQSSSAGGKGLLTEQMTGSAPGMDTFDFETVWQSQTAQYPRLAWQSKSSGTPPLRVTTGPDRVLREGKSVTLSGRPRIERTEQPDYSWNLVNGHGALSGSGTAVTYQAPSNVSENTTARVELTGSLNGQHATATLNLTVIPSQSAAPTARLSYAPKNPNTGDWLLFSGFESADPDGKIQTYQWSVDGESLTETTWGVGSGWFTDHQFDSAGKHTVALTVTDDDGETATVQETISVAQAADDSAAVEISDIEMRIQNVAECGLTCRDVTYAIENPTNTTVNDLTADIEVSTGGETIWQNEQEIGDVATGETATLRDKLELGQSEAASVLDNDGRVTITVELQSANETRILSFDREF